MLLQQHEWRACRCAADQEGQLDSERLLGVSGAGDVVGGHVGSHNFEHRRLDVLIGDALDVTIANLLVPNLKRLGTKEEKKTKKGAEGAAASVPLLHDCTRSQRADRSFASSTCERL